jgi:hypothetical protein
MDVSPGSDQKFQSHFAVQARFHPRFVADYQLA